MKKILTLIFMVFALMFGSQSLTNNIAEAADMYVGNMDGCEIYVQTETVRNNNTYVSVTTKSVRNNSWIGSETWYFDNVTGHWRYNTETMEKKAAKKGICANTTIVIQGSIVENILNIALQY